MAELKGMTGKIARVDLTKGSVTVIEPGEDVYRKYLAALRLGVYFLFKEGIVSPDVDPLGPDNMLQFMIGPVTGRAQCAFCNRDEKRIQLHFIATSGGQAATELKFAGWDGIQVVGKADKPSISPSSTIKSRSETPATCGARALTKPK